MKRCSECGEVRPVEEFSRDRSRHDGRMIRCRACDNARARRYYEANRERKLAKANARNAMLRAMLREARAKRPPERGA